MNPDGRSKATTHEMKMKIDLHPKIGERERLIIPISEFSFAAYPVLINQVFR